jgi:protein SCO1/2
MNCRASISCIILLATTAIARADLTFPQTLEKVRIDQRIGQAIPLNLSFTDDQGQPVQLSHYMHDRPAILVLAYYTCPNLCPMLQRHLTQGLNGIALVAGRDFDVVIASIDPDDTIDAARQQKLATIRAYRYRDQADGFHYLTGDQSSITRLEEAVGFHCVPNPERKQFAHALGAIVISPGGHISHAFLGVDFSPADLEASLKDAAIGKATTLAHADQQYCLDYSPATTRYGRIAVHTLQGVAVVWVLLMLGYIGRELHRDWRKIPAEMNRSNKEVQQ